MGLQADSQLERRSCDGVAALGSFWVRPDDSDLQSTLVKYFKQHDHSSTAKPGISAITQAYAVMLSEAALKWKPTAVVRVLASGETRPDPTRPHSALVRSVAEKLGLLDYTHLFFRTEPRRPMRMIDRFSGPNMLRQRIDYVLQDLFVIPHDIGGCVLVIDDIYNLGATASVYAAALKQFCGASRAYSANLAAARFSGGKDGWGRLSLDIDRFISLARPAIARDDPADAFDDAWVERGTAEFHSRSDCPRITGKTHRSILLFARRERAPCPSCAVRNPHGTIRRWLGNR